MALMWTLKASRPGVTDEVQFGTEAEALAYVEQHGSELQDATVFLVDSAGASRIIARNEEQSKTAAA